MIGKTSQYPAARRRHRAAVTTVSALALASGSGLLAYSRREVPPPPPLGLPAVRWPRDNPYSRDKAELGRLLFFDRRLSSDGKVACASCHLPERAFSDKGPVSEGIGKQKGRRNAPALLNRAYGEEQFWDARSASLEEQATAPLADRREMTSEPDAAAAHVACLARLRGVKGYREQFRRVFGSEAITLGQVAKAIATFERTIYSGNSAYDRYQAGDRAAMTPEQVSGMNLFFGKASCMACHEAPTFTGEIPANTGVGWKKRPPDRGRYEVTHLEWERGAFKPPTLREVERTGPYMHDGSVKTLEDAVEHYDKGAVANPYLDDRVMTPLHLTVAEKKALVAFLKALSGEGWQQIRAPREGEFPK